MNKHFYLFPILLVCLTTQAQESDQFLAEKSPLYSGADFSKEWLEPDDGLVLEQLEIAFSIGAPGNSITWVNEAGIVLLQIGGEFGHNNNIPVQIVADATDSGKAGLTELMDGLVVANTGSHAFLLAPVAWDPAALAEGLSAWGTIVQTDDGRLEIINPGFDPALHFSAAFTFTGIRQTDDTGAVVLQPPKIRDSNRNDQFYKLIYADGVEEILQPIIAAPLLLNAVAAMELEAKFDRNHGVLTINGKTWRPSYFVDALNDETSSYLRANVDSFDLAFKPGDINADGLVDYQVISPSGSQWLFGQPGSR